MLHASSQGRQTKPNLPSAFYTYDLMNVTSIQRIHIYMWKLLDIKRFTVFSYSCQWILANSTSTYYIYHIYILIWSQVIAALCFIRGKKKHTFAAMTAMRLRCRRRCCFPWVCLYLPHNQSNHRKICWPLTSHQVLHKKSSFARGRRRCRVRKVTCISVEGLMDISQACMSCCFL